MMPYKEDIFAEIQTVLAQADAGEIEQLLSDIAKGEFVGTALTRAGDNDSQVNVSAMQPDQKCQMKAALDGAANSNQRTRLSS